MKYLASLVLVLSLGSAAFAADDTAAASKASPISNKQAKDLVKADSNLKKAHRKHRHHKHAAKNAGATPAASTASPAPDATAPATK